jgi:hypothetical protein
MLYPIANQPSILQLQAQNIQFPDAELRLLADEGVFADLRHASEIIDWLGTHLFSGR